MEVVTEFHGLIASSHGMLTDNERSELLEFLEARELNLAFDTLCGFVLVENRRVTPELYLRIHSIGEKLDGVDRYLLESIKAVVAE